jgi:hypothetical protein
MVLRLCAAAAVLVARRLCGVNCHLNNCCAEWRCHACAAHVIRDACFPLHDAVKHGDFGCESESIGRSHLIMKQLDAALAELRV